MTFKRTLLLLLVMLIANACLPLSLAGVASGLYQSAQINDLKKEVRRDKSPNNQTGSCEPKTDSITFAENYYRSWR